MLMKSVLTENRLSKKHSAGFTLIEVISALMILGIISAVVFAGVSSNASYRRRVELDTLKAHLRFTQSRAMANNAPWGIDIQTSDTYVLFEAEPENVQRIPGEENNTVSLSALSLSSAPQTITFDGYGSVSTADVTISTNADSITITADTGFIP